MAKIKTDKKTNKVKLNKPKEETVKKIIKKVKTPENNIKLILKHKLGKEKIKQSKLKVDLDQVKVAIHGLFVLTKENVSKKLFDDEYPIFMQLVCIKIPQCPDRIIRLQMEKSFVTDGNEICLIVSDLEKGRRRDYNPTIEHYEEILRTNKITNIKRIIPVNCIKTEYDQYELKRRLAGQYDIFLTDGRVSGHLAHLLGKAFYEKRKLPTPIHFQRPNLKKNIEKALTKTQMHIHGKGNTYLTQIGHSKMSIDDITANFESACEELATKFPGGCENIRAIHLKTHLSVAIPVYMTLRNRNQVRPAFVPSKRPKLCKKVTGTLSTMDDENITVHPFGNVLVEKFEKKRLREESRK